MTNATIIIPENVKQIMTVLDKAGHNPRIIGGAIRDAYLGYTPHDWDLFCSASGEEILKLFPQGKVIGNEERQKKILTVIVDGVEVSQYRSSGDRTSVGSDLDVHLSTCDFTICSICADVNGTIYDPNNGLKDLENKVVRFVGDPNARIQEDPLRLLRAIRFMAKFNFSCEHLDTVVKQRTLLTRLPKERIREEFLKILEYEYGFLNLVSTSLIDFIIPKFRDNMLVPGGQHHAETVDVHLTLALLQMQKLTKDKRLWLAALLHDIAKGETLTLDETGIHFYEHDSKGADYVYNWMTDMKFAKEEINFVTCLIRNHMWQYDKTISKRSFIAYFNELNSNGVSVDDFLLLRYCDSQANMANERHKLGDALKEHPLLAKYYELKFSKEPFKISDLEIKGQDLIDFGVKPGKIFGDILTDVFNKVMDGVLINSRPVLMNYVRSEWISK